MLCVYKTLQIKHLQKWGFQINNLRCLRNHYCSSGSSQWPTPLIYRHLPAWGKPLATLRLTSWLIAPLPIFTISLV